MTTQTHHVDHELIQAAAHVARTRCRGDNHTMAAAARAQDGRIVTAVNAYHFTGGPLRRTGTRRRGSRSGRL